jgi:poly(glycerol-phosphate) alpha-glucosyltransferase
MSTLNTKVVTASASRLAGGLFSSVRRLHQTLSQKHGVNVSVFTLRDEFTDADKDFWQPLKIKHFPVVGPHKFGYSPALEKSMLASDADVGHTHGLWVYSSVVTLAWHRKTGRPYLISPHGMLDPWAMKNSQWKKKIAWRLFEYEHLRNAQCIRALCDSEAQSIRQLGLKNDIAVIPNGIDLPSGASFMAAPWRGFVEPGKKVLLFLSRIHPKKGPINLLHAWRQLHKQKHEWVLAVAGWDQGGHESELKQLATQLRIPWRDIREDADLSRGNRAGNLLFLGPQFNAAKDACYHHCDAFVLPSFSEGLPMVVLEAWANSKPVVMTPECNIPEGFSAGAAIKIKTDAASIATGLNTLLGMSAADRLAMGSRARALVEERFTWSRIADQLQSVYQWMLGGGAKPDCILSP